MRALLDINVLIALLDLDHPFTSGHGSGSAGTFRGWTSCPITQNGCMRIMTNPGYPNPLPIRTDLYLLALAVHRGGRFVTFDASVPVGAIRGAEKRHIVAL